MGTPYAERGWIPAQDVSVTQLELLAHLHDYGGRVTAWGAKTEVLRRAAHNGLVSIVYHGPDPEHPRRTVLAAEITDTKGIRNLAARCSAGLRAALAEAEIRGERYAGLHWRMVPHVVPPRAWPAGARACPQCKCNPDRPCTVVLDHDCGTGACVPAGLYDATTCSECR